MKLPALLVLARTQSRLGRPGAAEYLVSALNDSLSTGEAQYIIPARLANVEAAWLNDQHDSACQQIESLLTSDINPVGNWRDGELALWMHRYDIKSKAFIPKNLPKPYQLEIDGKYQAAATEWQKTGSPYQAALTLLNAPVSPDTTDSLTEAIQLLESIFAAGALNKAASIADSVGINKKRLIQKRRGPRKASKQHPLGLTEKEQEILPWIIKGLTNKEISEHFSRSERTIENHIASIYKKLNVHSRIEALLRVENEPWLLTDTIKKPIPSQNVIYNDAAVS